MSADLNAIRILLREQLFNVVDLPDVDHKIAWENKDFDTPSPDERDPWIREKLLVAGEQKTSTGFIMTLGQYRIDVFVPTGMGTKEAGSLAKNIKDAFLSGTNLQTDDASLAIHLYRTEQLSGRPDPGTSPLWYSIPVVINWRCFTSTT